MGDRRPLITGNWKMHKTASATRTLLTQLGKQLHGVGGVDVTVAPPFTALGAAAETLAGGGIGLGAQNMHPAEEGAFTGEISAVMLVDLGVQFVLVGHSERRAIFGESDELVGRKLRTALAHDLIPYLCCGETREQRESGDTEPVIERQLRAALQGLPRQRAGDIVVAYEPVWAIGTGLTASPEQAQNAHAFIRGLLADLLGPENAARIRIQYGGSVKPGNAAELLSERDIDGALIGGASLDADSFAGIIRAVAR